MMQAFPPAWKARLSKAGWRSVLLRGALLGGGFMVLAAGDPASIPFAIPVTLLALLASVLLPTPQAPAWRPTGLLRYALAFASGSLQGGFDVARRAFSPDPSLRPALLHFETWLSTAASQNLFTSTINLMPGTLCATVEGRSMTVHVLVEKPDFDQRLRRLEARVASAMGEPEPEPSTGERP